MPTNLNNPAENDTIAAIAIDNDTIAAIATAPGMAGVAVLRVSGPASFDIARRVFRPRAGDAATWPARRMILGDFVDAAGLAADSGFLVCFPGPHSYTGEDVVELHTHGGLAAPAAVLRLVLDAGARLAEPGEFTRRAVVLGRIDLTEAEAVLDVIHARSEAALRAARSRMNGALSGRVRTIRERLIKGKALIEAEIDFEESDIGDLDREAPARLAGEVARDLADLAATHRKGRIYRDGATAVIAGRPNVGKSSLLNALVGRARAIVAETPGTTRDAVEAEAVLDGVVFRLVDTAGLRGEADAIETAGMAMTRERLAEADVVVFVFDASEGYTGEDAALEAQIPPVPVVRVGNKIDLAEWGSVAHSAVHGEHGEDTEDTEEKRQHTRDDSSRDDRLRDGQSRDDRLRDGQSRDREGAGGIAAGETPALPGPQSSFLATSAKTGAGIADLASAMAEAALGTPATGEESALVAGERHARQIESARQSAEAARDAAAGGASPAIVALELDDALRALSELLGETTPDDVLDHIFARFCIGK